MPGKHWSVTELAIANVVDLALPEGTPTATAVAMFKKIATVVRSAVRIPHRSDGAIYDKIRTAIPIPIPSKPTTKQSNTTSSTKTNKKKRKRSPTSTHSNAIKKRKTETETEKSKKKRKKRKKRKKKKKRRRTERNASPSLTPLPSPIQEPGINMTHPDPWQQQQHSNDLDPFMPFNCNQIDLHLPPPHREPSPFDLHLPPPHSLVKELSPEYRIQPIDNSDKEPSMPSMECPRPSMPFCIEIDLEEDDVPSQTAPILCCSEFIIMLLRVHLYRLGMIIFIIGCLCIRTIHSQVMDLDNQFTCYLYASHSHTHPLNAGSIFGEYAWCESIGMQLDITYRADNASKANTETNETIPTLYLYMYPLCYMHLLSIEHVESLFISRYGDLICNLALQAVMIVREPNQEIREMEAKSEQKDAFAQVKHIVIDTKRFARVERIPGGQMEDSYVLDDITNPRIICLDIPMEYNKGESQTNIEITKEADFERYLQIEEDYIKKSCDKLISLKPDVVVTEKGCSDLARCSGATIGHRIDLLTEKDVGTKCGEYCMKQIANETFSFRLQTEPKACSIILRGGSKDVLQESTLQDAMCVTRNILLNAKILPGGGDELALSGHFPCAFFSMVIQHSNLNFYLMDLICFDSESNQKRDGIMFQAGSTLDWDERNFYVI